MTQDTLVPLLVRRDCFGPDARLTRRRSREPVAPITLPWGETAWLVTRYEDVRAVMGDSARFANGHPLTTREDRSGSVSSAGSGLLGAYDPPEHTVLRRMLSPEFTVKRLRRLRPRIEEIVAGHLDAMERSGPPADLVEAFSLPIPSLVICELLGVPYGDRAGFQRRSARRLDMSLGVEERIAAVEESRAYMAGLVERERSAPGEGLIGMLVREHGDTLSDRELTGVCDLLLLAGHETTANMLSLGVLLLLLRPDQAALMRDDDHVDGGVEELLRYLSVVHAGLPRIAQVDVVLGGREIKAGDLVVCSLPTANRDERLGPGLDRFDVTRKAPGHLAFGHGIHHCLGAPLARIEMRIAYPALLRRLPGLRPAVPYAEVPFRSSSAVFGLDALPVTW
ncbi:cytochrome P450 [Microbispora sp. NPDC088329]|uniref:cytochrome P450 n=1 Tax=Microbispora sp. NPDC088329 TaxID=3154869 RepID=UPI00341E46B3